MISSLLVGACYGGPEAYLEGPAIAVVGDQPILAGSTEPQIIAPPPTPGGRSASVGSEAPYAEGLTLGEAVHRALRFSPAVQAAQIEIDVKRAENLQDRKSVV